jgi:hypothetical protein
MAVIRKVEVLNKPYRFYGFTIKQMIMLVVALIIAWNVGMTMPNVKIGSGLYLSFIVGILIFCGSIVFIFATDLRPWAWWRNRFLYSFGLRTRIYLPKALPGRIYPDATIIDQNKEKLSQPYYRETEAHEKMKRKPAK